MAWSMSMTAAPSGGGMRSETFPRHEDAAARAVDDETPDVVVAVGDVVAELGLTLDVVMAACLALLDLPVEGLAIDHLLPLHGLLERGAIPDRDVDQLAVAGRVGAGDSPVLEVLGEVPCVRLGCVDPHLHDADEAGLVPLVPTPGVGGVLLF